MKEKGKLEEWKESKITHIKLRLHSTSDGTKLHPTRMFCFYFYFSLRVNEFKVTP